MPETEQWAAGVVRVRRGRLSSRPRRHVGPAGELRGGRPTAEAESLRASVERATWANGKEATGGPEIVGGR